MEMLTDSVFLQCFCASQTVSETRLRLYLSLHETRFMSGALCLKVVLADLPKVLYVFRLQ